METWASEIKDDMKIDPNKIVMLPVSLYEITVVLQQLQTSIPEPGNQMAVVNVINKLRKAFDDGSKLD